MTKSRVLKLEQGLETVVTQCSEYAHAMKKGPHRRIRSGGKHVDESMSFFRGSETFGVTVPT
jgi:hypothetical protein